VRIRRLLLLLALLPALAGCDATAPGRDLYAEGRFAEALAAFDEAVERAGDDATAPLLYDQALAAVRVGRFREAETAARRAREAPGGDALAARCDFVLGNAAFLRSQAAEVEANRPDGEPTAHEWAVASAEDALAAWRRAAASGPDWPEARRNVERALLRLARLREQRAGGRGRVEIPRPPTPEAPPRAPQPDEARDPPDTQAAPLSPRELAGLFDLLQEKERRKLEMRRADRRSRGGDVERDW
jgi:tetratricopeptide (TPR) repeat protein